MVLGTVLMLALVFGVLVAASYVGTKLALQSYFGGNGPPSRGSDRRSGGSREWQSRGRDGDRDAGGWRSRVDRDSSSDRRED